MISALRRFWLFLSAMLAIASFTSQEVVAAISPVSDQQLAKAITKFRSETNITGRTEAALQIATLVKGADLSAVTPATLSNLISLLDTDEDSVRLWVAGALGNFGTRAKPAVPRLLAILPEVDCATLRGLNSAGVIRVALEKIGSPAPPANCDFATKKPEGA